MVQRPKGVKILHYRASQFFQNDLEELAHKILIYNEFQKPSFKVIYPIPRGGLVLATCLSHLLKIPIELGFEKLKKNFRPAEVLVVDDIADYGRALGLFVKAGYGTLTIHKKLRSAVVPTFYIYEIENNIWISYFWGDCDGKYIEA